MLMKPHLVIAICAMLLVGCVKSGPLSTSDMEDLFLYSYTNSVKPVTMSPLDNEGLEGLLAQIYLNDNGFLETEFRDGDVAVVINDPSKLKAVTRPDGEKFDLSEIDFNKYSLVIGRLFMPDYSFRMNDQRVLKDDGKLTLVVKCDRSGGAFAAIYYEFFAVLYPKLPDSPMTVSVLVKEDN